MSEAEAKKFVEYSAVFQTKMLRTLVQETDFACNVLPHLDPSLFDGKVKRWLASTLVNHVKKHAAAASLDALRIQLQRALKVRRLQEADRAEAEALLAKLTKPVKDRSFVKEEIHRFVKHQITVDAIMKCVDHVEAGDFEAVDHEMQRVLEVSSLNQGGLGHFYVQDLAKRIKERKEAPPEGFATGTKLDDYLRSGGLWRGALGIIMAELGGGKSSSLVSMGRSAIVNNGAKVLHVTVELPEREILDKYDAAFGDIPINNLVEEEEPLAEIVRDLGTRYGEFLVVKEFPSVTLTIPMLRAYMRRLEAVPFVPDVVVIDYLDEMIPSIHVDMSDVTQVQGAVYREARKMAMELKIAVWSAVQTNREGLDRELLTAKHTGGAVAKGQLADYFWAICRTPAEKKANLGRGFVIKSRGGPSNKEVPLKLDWARSLMTDPA